MPVNWKQRLQEEIAVTEKFLKKFKFHVQYDSLNSMLLANARTIMKSGNVVLIKDQVYALQARRKQSL